jgi:hypothetical protein
MHDAPRLRRPRPRQRGELGPLPEWDLSALYAGPDDPALAADMDWLRDEGAAFATRYEGRLGGLDAAGMLACIREYEAIQNKAGRVMSYVGLRHYQNTLDPARAKAFGDAQGRVTEATTPLVFFTLELNRLEDAHLDAPARRGSRPRPLPPGPAPHPGDEALPALRRARALPARPVRRRRRRLEPALRRDDGRASSSTSTARPCRSRPPSTASPTTTAPAARPAARALAAVFTGKAPALRPHHQHARQGEGDRGPLAQAADAPDRAPPLQRRRARGGRGARTPSSPPTPSSRTATTR